MGLFGNKRGKAVKVPPESYRKYPWALREIKPPERFVYEDPEEGARAGRAARAWTRRNPDLGLRCHVRAVPEGIGIYFVKRIEVKNEREARQTV